MYLCVKIWLQLLILFYVYTWLCFHPLTIITNQGTYFINDAIRYLTNRLIKRHTYSTMYYLQENGQVESINKVFGTVFIKLVNEIVMIGTSIGPQYFFHIAPHTSLELVIHLFNLFMDYIHCYRQNIYYQLDLKKS